jgi:hypothetical protein
MALAGVMLCAMLLLGVMGYHYIAELNWIDSILEASMILSGMGPVSPLKTGGSKLFASAFALLSGVFFIVVMGIVLAPMLHRVMHKFHLEVGSDKNS